MEYGHWKVLIKLNYCSFNFCFFSSINNVFFIKIKTIFPPLNISPDAFMTSYIVWERLQNSIFITYTHFCPTIPLQIDLLFWIRQKIYMFLRHDRLINCFYLPPTMHLNVNASLEVMWRSCKKPGKVNTKVRNQNSVFFRNITYFVLFIASLP